MLGRVSLALLVVLTACGGSSDDPPAGVDAPDNGIDAPPPTVVEVTPCAGEVQTIESTGGFRFAAAGGGSPNITISQGEIVKFISGSTHNVVPLFPMSDSGLSLPQLGGTGCLRFTATGKFNFKCQPHPSMTGSVTVN